MADDFELVQETLAQVIEHELGHHLSPALIDSAAQQLVDALHPLRHGHCVHRNAYWRARAENARLQAEVDFWDHFYDDAFHGDPYLSGAMRHEVERLRSAASQGLRS